MVTNPKYIGSNVSNRRSGKLRSRRSWNPPEMWIRRDNAFHPIVDLDVWEKAEAVALARVRRYTDEHLLQFLRDFLQRTGELSTRAIRNDVDMPCAQIYKERFGGLVGAYRKIGYTPQRNFDYVERDRPLRLTRVLFVQTITQELARLRVPVVQNSRTKVYCLNENLTVRLSMARCQTKGQSHHWRVQINRRATTDVTILARLAPGNAAIQDYFCLPRRVIDGIRQVTLRPDTESALDRYQFGDLRFLKNLARRSRKAR